MRGGVMWEEWSRGEESCGRSGHEESCGRRSGHERRSHVGGVVMRGGVMWEEWS